jgi:hypothetical protein
MKSLYLRVWLTVVAVLALFALGSGWLFQHQMERERGRFDAAASERLNAWGDLLQHALPPAQAPAQEQAQGLLEWSERLHVALALDDARGQRLSESEAPAGPAATARPCCRPRPGCAAPGWWRCWRCCSWAWPPAPTRWCGA